MSVCVAYVIAVRFIIPFSFFRMFRDCRNDGTAQGGLFRYNQFFPLIPLFLCFFGLFLETFSSVLMLFTLLFAVVQYDSSSNFVSIFLNQIPPQSSFYYFHIMFQFFYIFLKSFSTFYLFFD